MSQFNKAETDKINALADRIEAAIKLDGEHDTNILTMALISIIAGVGVAVMQYDEHFTPDSIVDLVAHNLRLMFGDAMARRKTN